MKRILLFSLLFIVFVSSAQDSTKTSKLTWNAYLDVYYAYDFANPASHERPSFLYNHTRHNEINLNLGFVRAAYSSEKIRASLALMAGTYAQYNLAQEQGLLKNVYEAVAGIKIVEKHNLWLDAGIFSSHIGFESAVSKDCWTLTRSLVAENSPYYLSGAKLTYTTKNDKWLFLLAYLNGWQRIQRVPGQNNPNLSTQIQFKPNSKWTLNYSTFLGSDKPDSAMQKRYYHNLYAIWQPLPKWGLILGVDYGMEQKTKGSSDYNQWYVTTAILRYIITDKWTTAARAEYFDDANGVIIATGTPNGFKTTGYSLNLDYQPLKNTVVRVEGRLFKSKDNLFLGSDPHLNFAIIGSIAVYL